MPWQFTKLNTIIWSAACWMTFDPDFMRKAKKKQKSRYLIQNTAISPIIQASEVWNFRFSARLQKYPIASSRSYSYIKAVFDSAESIFYRRLLKANKFIRGSRSLSVLTITFDQSGAKLIELKLISNLGWNAKRVAMHLPGQEIDWYDYDMLRS